jgi:hypothetical protein
MPKKTRKPKKHRFFSSTRKMKRRGGGGGDSMKKKNCSQTMVVYPLSDCVKKHCIDSKHHKQLAKLIAKLKHQYDTETSKKCNIKPDESGELFPKTEDQWKCYEEQHDSAAFQNILKLRREAEVLPCQEKHCAAVDYLADCVVLGEEKCRIKYKDLIARIEKKKKIKMSPLDVCL